MLEIKIFLSYRQGQKLEKFENHVFCIEESKTQKSGGTGLYFGQPFEKIGVRPLRTLFFHRT